MIEKNEYLKALEIINDIVVEIDFRNDTVFTDEDKFIKFFGFCPRREASRDSALFNGDYLHPDDYSRVLNYVSDASATRTAPLEIEFRMYLNGEKNEYSWVKCVVVPLVIACERWTRVIALFNNIAREKKESLALMDAVKRDALTELYNKKHTETAINKLLDTTHCGAMFSVDIDDFKSVNDNLGHLLGDAVIVSTSNSLKKIFVGESILGRCGGDEFIAFMPNIDCVRAKAVAEEILSAISVMRYGQEQEYHITASVGIAMFPMDGETYKALYSLADLAGYYAKVRGKNRAEFYTIDMNWDTLGYVAERDIAPEEEITSNFIEYIYHILNDTKELALALELALGMVSQKFNISRSFLCEFDKNGKCKALNTYMADNDMQQIDDVIPLFERREYRSNFKNYGVYKCANVDEVIFAQSREMLNKAGIKSFIHYAITKNSVFSGTIGFESKEILSEKDFSALGFIAKIMSVFIIRQRAERELRERSIHYENMLNSISGIIYTLDPKTYKLKYVSKNTKTFFIGAKEGDYCYERFYGESSVCKECPIPKLKGGHLKFMTKNYSPYGLIRTRYDTIDNIDKTAKEIMCSAELKQDKKRSITPIIGTIEENYKQPVVYKIDEGEDNEKK